MMLSIVLLTRGAFFIKSCTKFVQYIGVGYISLPKAAFFSQICKANFSDELGDDDFSEALNTSKRRKKQSLFD